MTHTHVCRCKTCDRQMGGVIPLTGAARRLEQEVNGLLIENSNLRGVRDQLLADHQADVERLSGILSLAEEGPANYEEENQRLRTALNEVLEELRLGDTRHDLQAKIILALGSPPPQTADKP